MCLGLYVCRQKFVHPLRTTIPNIREHIVHLDGQPMVKMP
jgi:hypothetical protein